jgi:hypothetical protein
VVLARNEYDGKVIPGGKRRRDRRKKKGKKKRNGGSVGSTITHIIIASKIAINLCESY